jgi:hypothetical protein
MQFFKLVIYKLKNQNNSSIIIQNSEVNNVQNVTIVQKAITKSSVGQHGPPTNAKVGSGA